MIPVMLMGKMISGKSYPSYDYAVAVAIMCGVSVFSLNSENNKASESEHTTTIAGVILIVGYLVFDSFTSQWQGHLFKEYKMSSYQMMLGVNSFSAFFSLMSLLENGELFSSLAFITKDPEVGLHIFAFSVAGATGQMFIFYTIKTFGPLVFTMIMTTRQLVAIVLSCILFSHAITPGSMAGVFIVFSAVCFRIWRQQQDKKAPKQPAAAEMTKQ